MRTESLDGLVMHHSIGSIASRLVMYLPRNPRSPQIIHFEAGGVGKVCQKDLANVGLASTRMAAKDDDLLAIGGRMFVRFLH